MKRLKLALTIVLLVMCSATAGAYQLAGDHIRTLWAENIDVNQPWNEYPRPMMQRQQWLNLNGMWSYAITDKQTAKPAAWQGEILVPFCVESALSGVGKLLDESHALWYRTSFAVPKKWDKRQRVMLNFGAVDWSAEVWVNGIRVGSHTGGYTAFSFDVTDALVRKGDNELVVRVLDATDVGYQPCGKQRSKARGIWYTPVSGIWQTVWLEPVPQTRIKRVYCHPDIKAGTVAVETLSDQLVGTTEVRLIDNKGKVMARAEASLLPVLTLPQPVKLWTPDDPNLYDIEVLLKDAKGKVVDRVRSYFAMREFGMARDSEGFMRFTLNGEPIFQFGLLDQGWWPDGLYTAPSPEALYYDIDKTRQWGFNLIRKHVKVEPELWYAHCDRVGIIVWQDMPSGDYECGQPWDDWGHSYYRGSVVCKRSQESIENYYKEWGEIIDQFGVYGCIASWVPFNEAWGQFNTWSVVNWTKQRDSSRLVNPASGGNLYCCGDILDVHNYPEPKFFFADPDRVLVMGEYGGIGYPVQDHTWVKSDQNWGYIKFSSAQDVTDTYIKYAQMLIDLAQKRGYSGAIYTQTTDCETEVNGIMTYDRRVVKMQEDRIATINRQVIKALGN